MKKKATDEAAPKRQLTLLDSTCIIVGIIIGSGIYKATPLVAAHVPDAKSLIFVWLAGGAISLIGAMCYVELATAYPREGGDYVFLTRAYGRRAGFLYAWSEFWVIRTGNVGMLAYVLADYAQQLYPLQLVENNPAIDKIVYAGSSVIVLTGLNLLGVRSGKWTQNLLTIVKVAGLLAIFAVALLIAPETTPTAQTFRGRPDSILPLAMVFVLFTYGGWNDMSFVAAEVRDPSKNIFRALLLGTLAVTVIYVLVNLAFVRILGFGGVAQSQALAADVLERPLGDWGARLMSTLVCISCLGAINGMMFTGARIYYAFGKEHAMFAWLGHWSARFDAPIRPLLLQSLITLSLIVAVGFNGRGFETLLAFTTPIFWAFILMVGCSLFVLRYKEPNVPRPFRVPVYPLLPIAFCLSVVFMLYQSVSYALTQRGDEAYWAFGICAAGVAVSFFDSARRQ